jgi:hypothetical protein
VRFSVTATVMQSFRFGYHRPSGSPAWNPRSRSFASRAVASPGTFSANSFTNGVWKRSDTPGTFVNCSAA